MKYLEMLIILVLTIAFVMWASYTYADSYHHNVIVEKEPDKVINQSITVINQAKNKAFAALAAMSSIPDLPHKKGHGHTGVGFGFGYHDDNEGAAIGLTHQCDKTSYKINLGASGGETVVGAGVVISF